MSEFIEIFCAGTFTSASQTLHCVYCIVNNYNHMECMYISVWDFNSGLKILSFWWSKVLQEVVFQ